MNILGIETSCDETAAAVVTNGRVIRSSIISSQIAIHKPFNGVVPELASRAHVRTINAVVASALKKAGIPLPDLSSHIAAIVYTRGPGLAGSLLVGQLAAETLSWLTGVPLVDINHLEGHLYAALLEHPRLKPPYLALVVSGGHTELVLVNDYGRYRVLGATRDDAAGEAYDKVAKLLGLPYPGGPAIDGLARAGDPAAVAFPRPYMRETWDFSFSGLKTAVANYLARCAKPGTPLTRSVVRDICASFQQAVVDTLVEKTMAAAQRYDMRTVVIGGGVAANTALRAAMTARARAQGVRVCLPSLSLCTDNAAMVACAGYYKLQSGQARPVVAGAAHALAIEPGMTLRDWAAGAEPSPRRNKQRDPRNLSVKKGSR